MCRQNTCTEAKTVKLRASIAVRGSNPHILHGPPISSRRHSCFNAPATVKLCSERVQLLYCQLRQGCRAEASRHGGRELPRLGRQSQVAVKPVNNEIICTHSMGANVSAAVILPQPQRRILGLRAHFISPCLGGGRCKGNGTQMTGSSTASINTDIRPQILVLTHALREDQKKVAEWQHFN